MAIYHSKKLVSSTVRQRSLARIVKRELIKRGYETRFISIIDRYGARLLPFDLAVGDVQIMVRSVGYRLTPIEQTAINDTAGAYVQHGAHDLTALIAHIDRYQRLLTASHWAKA